MDDVSGLADRSDEFANFLTVSRKYGLPSLYIFCTIYLTRQNWQMIMSQTKIFIFFQALFKRLQSLKFCHLLQIGIKIIISVTEIFGSIEISNSRQKQCLTIDTRDANELGPTKFRTKADSGTEQICYYNRNKEDDTCFDSFFAVTKQTSSPFEINFSIVKSLIVQIDKTLYILKSATN